MLFEPNTTIYFVGIKGVGMTALAVILKEMGMNVSGSDVAKPFITDAQLAAHGIEVFEGFDSSRVAKVNPSVVVVGASWGDDHEEVAAAHDSTAQVILYSEALGEISKLKKTIAVSGTHGKTTTSSLTAFLMERAGLNPGYVIGTGTVPDLDGNGKWGTGEHFVVEADDYKKAPDIEIPKFMDLDPAVVILTSSEYDHPDFFKSLDHIEGVFANLLNSLREDGYGVVFLDDPSVKRIIKNTDKPLETYGESEEAAWRIRISESENGSTFTLTHGEEDFGEFKILMSGRHYVWNAVAGIIVALKEGADVEKIRGALPEFTGAQRRFEVHKAKGVTFVDDYAHHPTAVKLTLEGARKRWPEKKIWCFYQPHQVSRTEALMKEFGAAFGAADKVLLVDIFASAREVTDGVTSEDLAKEVGKHHDDVAYVGSIEEARAYLEEHFKEADVIFTMGAGDIYEIAETFFHV